EANLAIAAHQKTSSLLFFKEQLVTFIYFQKLEFIQSKVKFLFYFIVVMFSNSNSSNFEELVDKTLLKLSDDKKFIKNRVMTISFDLMMLKNASVDCTITRRKGFTDLTETESPSASQSTSMLLSQEDEQLFGLTITELAEKPRKRCLPNTTKYKISTLKRSALKWYWNKHC
ncbi:13905_t:CDS:2, partial [Gigaspora rosea]